MAPQRVAVCVATRCREAGLARALAGIAKQNLSERDVGLRLRVIVVDNDAAGSAAAVCDRLRSGYPWPLLYTIEPRVGITFARNRAIEMGKTDDFIAFLDDDEVPAENWISQLLFAQRQYGADVVFGPALTYFPEPVPQWAAEGPFFHKPRKPTGTICATGSTQNVLFSTRILEDPGLRFAEKFALSGSEDYDFFQRVSRAGYRLVWADEAIVTEWYPQTRANLSWLLQRHFRYGSTEISLRAVESLPERALEAMTALGRIVVGVTCAVMFIPLGKRYSINALRWVSFGLGLLYGLSGKQFREYRTVHPV
jgi:GT2 family glycosyltransferase